MNSRVLSGGFSLINVEKTEQNEEEADFFDVQLSATLFSFWIRWGVFSAVEEKKLGEEERGIELMNEGDYKNRKPQGDRGK